MKKPESLRAKLTAAFPELAADPNRLRMWTEKGALHHHMAPGNYNFVVTYTLTVVVEEWSHPAITLWVLLLDWLRIQQPDLVTPSNANGVFFEADILTTEDGDLSFDLPLREAIRVMRREDGGFNMEYVAEPDPLFPDTVPLFPETPLLKSIWVEGRQLLPEDLP